MAQRTQNTLVYNVRVSPGGIAKRSRYGGIFMQIVRKVCQ